MALRRFIQTRAGWPSRPPVSLSSCRMLENENEGPRRVHVAYLAYDYGPRSFFTEKFHPSFTPVNRSTRTQQHQQQQQSSALPLFSLPKDRGQMVPRAGGGRSLGSSGPQAGGGLLLSRRAIQIYAFLFINTLIFVMRSQWM